MQNKLNYILNSHFSFHKLRKKRTTLKNILVPSKFETKFNLVQLQISPKIVQQKLFESPQRVSNNKKRNPRANRKVHSVFCNIKKSF